MTFGAPVPSGPPPRAMVGLLVSAFGMAGSVTLVWLGMRAVLDIGGACADGGPYVSAQPCPEGVAILLTLGIFALFGFGGVGFWAGAQVGGPWVGLPLLAWPGLFLSLGWNFLEYGIAPPEAFGTGPELGWLIPGVIFVLMGGVPLVIAWRTRDEIRSDGGSAIGVRFGMPAVVASRSARFGAPAPNAGSKPAEPRGGHPREDLVDRLERLARMRRAGDLTNAEYEAAKAAIIGATDGRP